MTDHESNLEAAWERALERGQFRLGGDVDAATCAERWPEYNAQELCMQAAREALDDDQDRIHPDHFETAADAIDAVDDRLADDPGEPVGVGGSANASGDADRVADLEATIADLEERVDRLEAAILEVSE